MRGRTWGTRPRSTRNSHLPAEEAGADGEARTNRSQKGQAYMLQPMVVKRCLHGQRDGGGSSVPEAVDVDDHPLQGQAQALRSRKNDALVRLMRDEAAEITCGDVVDL